MLQRKETEIGQQDTNPRPVGAQGKWQRYTPIKHRVQGTGLPAMLYSFRIVTRDSGKIQTKDSSDSIVLRGQHFTLLH